MDARSAAVVPRAIYVGWGVNRESVRCPQFAAALDQENGRGSLSCEPGQDPDRSHQIRGRRWLSGSPMKMTLSVGPDAGDLITPGPFGSGTV